jgi:hypothetical protein
MLLDLYAYTCTCNNKQTKLSKETNLYPTEISIGCMYKSNITLHEINENAIFEIVFKLNMHNSILQFIFVILLHQECRLQKLF